MSKLNSCKIYTVMFVLFFATKMPIFLHALYIIARMTSRFYTILTILSNIVEWMFFLVLSLSLSNGDSQMCSSVLPLTLKWVKMLIRESRCYSFCNYATYSFFRFLFTCKGGLFDCLTSEWKMAAVAGTYAYHLSFPPQWQVYFNRNEPNLESHQLLWADRRLDDININGEELFSTLTQFHQLVNYTKAFDHWRTCLDYIKKTDDDTSTFLVCSVAYAKGIIPQLHFLEKITVWRVYVYCPEGLQNQLEYLERNSSVSMIWIHRVRYQHFELCFFSKEYTLCIEI